MLIQEFFSVNIIVCEVWEKVQHINKTDYLQQVQ